MSARACRICLATDVKMYSLKREPLKTAVEIILTINGDPSSFPQFMCYQCSAIIIKCLKFIEKSKVSETILYDIYDMQGEISQSTLRAVNRQSRQLEYNLKVHNCPIISYTEIQNCKVELTNENESDLIMMLEDGGNLENDASAVELDNDILFKEGQESLFSFDVELKLEKTKFHSVPLPLPPDIKPCKKIKKEKQIKPKTNRNEKKTKIPKSKNETANGRKRKVIKRKYLKDIDENFKEYYTVVFLTYEEQLEEMKVRKREVAYENFPHKCDKCYKGYRSAEAYYNHMNEHNPSRGLLECAVCRKMFVKRSLLVRHIACVHERQYHCKLCPYVGKNRQAVKHMKKHQGEEKLVKCSHCNFVADGTSVLSRHVASRHCGAAVRCDVCGKRFATQRGRDIHVTRTHKPTKENYLFEYKCDDCEVLFHKETDYKKHFNEKHKEGGDEKREYCKKCNETFLSIEDLSEHNTGLHSSDNVYPINCKHCNKIMNCSRDYWNHIVREHPSEKKNYHSPKRSFLCDTCGKGFKSITDLRLHGARHSGSRAVACGKCPRMFYDHYQAQTHRKNVHSEQRPHKCPQCELRFKVKSNLNRHMVVHTGERNYVCSLCNKSFTQACSRNLHVRTVHHKIAQKRRKRDRTRLPGASKPLASVRLGSVPLAGEPLTSAPLGSVVLASVPLDSEPLESVLLANVSHDNNVE